MTGESASWRGVAVSWWGTGRTILRGSRQVTRGIQQRRQSHHHLSRHERLCHHHTVGDPIGGPLLSGFSAHVNHRQANGAIHRLSVTDELTGLLNRRGFYEAAERELRASPSLTIIFIDVDGLKAVNDGLGHAAGDALLRDAAETIKSSFRQTDVVARVGGDEFCVLVPHPVGDPDGLKHALSERFDKFNSSEVREYRLSASIGVAPSEGSADLDALILEADRRMYAEKQRRYSTGDANSIRRQSEPA